MKLKKVLTLLTAVSMLGLNAGAQTDDATTWGDIRWSAALTLGSNSNTAVTALSGAQAVYGTEAVSTLWSQKGLGFGIEGGVQIGPSWRILLGGTYNYCYSPGYFGVPGTADPEATEEEMYGEIPTYRSVPQQAASSFMAYTGFDYLFRKGKALRPNVGMRFAGSFATSDKSDDFNALAMGKSMAEFFYLKTAVSAGIDYFFTDQFYLGCSINVVDYTYGLSRYQPQEGLTYLKADSHNIGVIANPTLKIGFRFGSPKK